MFKDASRRRHRLVGIGVSLLVILCSFLGAIFVNNASSRTAHAASSGFVYRCGIHFCLDGKNFYFAGTNTYDMFTYGDGSSTSDQNAIENNYMDKAKIDSHMAALEADGVSVLRLWAFSHESWHGFEPSKGVYNEAEFELFDYIIQSAAAHNIKLLPVLENYWTAYGGIDAVLGWEGVSGGDSNRWQFFNQSKCPGCFTDYKDYVSHVLNHVNHYTGVAWKDDPTIFGWELMNEPRYQNATPNENTTGTTLRAWVDTMGAYIKSIDPNHMLDAGLEGHQSSYGFGGDEGNPFIYIQESPYIDFTSAHPYPTESWANLSIAQTQALVGQWISDSHNVVGKPFFMGEFNVSNVDRSSWWSAIYSEMESAGGDGDAFWWYETTNVDGTYGVLQGAPELAVFRQHSANMLAKDGLSGSPTPVSTRTPTTTPTVGTTPTPTPTVGTTPTPTPTVGMTPTPTPTPVPVLNNTDTLNDFSKIFAHSNNLIFDSGNTTYFGGDTSRLTRTVTSAEWATWKATGITAFQLMGYFWPYQSGVNDFQFFASSDNSTFTQVAPVKNNLGGDWTRIQYTVFLPTGTSYVKVVFPTNANDAWNPQIGQVAYNGTAVSSSTTTVIDPLNDRSQIVSCSSGLTFDNTNTTYFGGDASRLTRTTTSAEWAIWQLNGMTYFELSSYFWPYQSGVNDFQFFVSSNNSTFTQVTPVKNNLGGDWTRIVYQVTVPAGTNYVKVVFPTNSSQVWNPQISQVTYHN